MMRTGWSVRLTLVVAMTTLVSWQRASCRLLTVECMTNSRQVPVCASATADMQVGPARGLTGLLGCTMSCTLDLECVGFNHVTSGSPPCQLFYNDPTSFIVVDGCHYYYSPSPSRDHTSPLTSRQRFAIGSVRPSVCPSIT